MSWSQPLLVDIVPQGKIYTSFILHYTSFILSIFKITQYLQPPTHLIYVHDQSKFHFMMQ